MRLHGLSKQGTGSQPYHNFQKRCDGRRWTREHPWPTLGVEAHPEQPQPEYEHGHVHDALLTASIEQPEGVRISLLTRISVPGT